MPPHRSGRSLICRRAPLLVATFIASRFGDLAGVEAEIGPTRLSRLRAKSGRFAAIRAATLFLQRPTQAWFPQQRIVTSSEDLTSRPPEAWAHIHCVRCAFAHCQALQAWAGATTVSPEPPMPVAGPVRAVTSAARGLGLDPGPSDPPTPGMLASRMRPDR